MCIRDRIDGEYVSWEGILTRTPEAHILLSEIAQIFYTEEKWGEGDAQVTVTLSCGAEYVVPVPDDNPKSFFEALSAAAPHADSTTRLGSLESPWPYIRQAILNKIVSD